jgi:adenylyltransferase/sulfurtransferase
MSLSEAQIERYGRQLILPEIGSEGQRRLAQARVLIVGAGGLGSPAALYLAAGGVGTLGILDDETVELSNLHRQILHTMRDLGRPKSQSAKDRLEALNPQTTVVSIHDRLTSATARGHLTSYDIIPDGSDNFPTHYLVNDACILLGKPLVHGGIVRFEGQAMTILPKQGPCFRCVFPEPPDREAIPNCQQAGVLGSVAGILGSLMAQEVFKLVLGVGNPLVGRLLVFDGLASHFREVPIRRNPDCAVCGDHPTLRTLIDHNASCGSHGGHIARGAVMSSQ